MRRLLLLLALSSAPLAAQSPYLQADSALALHQAWRATQLLQPLLEDSATRTPDVVILAARSAAAWEGWPTVRRLLEPARWLDTRYDRLGHRLLAEAALAEQRNTDALTQALASVEPLDSNRGHDEQGRRLLLLARAYDRADQLDSAAAVYRRAIALLPDLADWIALRAAGVTSDSLARAQLYAMVALSAAVPRVPWTEALARDRSDDFAGAVTRYDRLGAHAAALKVRWRAATSDSDRSAVAAALATLLRTAPTADALDLAEQIAPPFTREDRLSFARAAVAANRSQDAVDAFATAAAAAPLGDKDLIAYGTALGQLSRWSDAAAVFRTVRAPAYAGQAAYYSARAVSRSGQADVAAAALRRVVRLYPRDTAAAATALYLLADIATDAGQSDSARANYLRIGARYPTYRQRPHAILLAAIIAYARGKPDVAARELTRALEAHSVTGEVDAAHYWLARAEAATGDTASARSIWRELTTHGPDNYYAVRAAERLDTLPWQRFPADSTPPPDSLDGVFARAQRLDAFGLAAEAKFERDRLAADAKGPATLERVGDAFLEHGFASQAAKLGNRAVAAGAQRDRALWQMLYPMPFADVLRHDAEAERLDPLLVASVIRQESGFEPHATSRTNARGLMQVEPATGRDLAPAFGLRDFDPALLWIPDVNLAMGTRHFATGLTRYPEIERGLAAYNAGVSRVDRWSMTPLSGKVRSAEHARDALDDIDLFVERIPFVETRDYVRAIVRNRAVYRVVYGGK